jgi:multicomponent K+:H+ antiporter subunit E
MKRFPTVLTVALVVMWLLLNDTLAPGQILLGAVVAVATVYVFRRTRPLQPRLRARPQVIVQLLFRVLIDIVRSNVGVARVILGLVGAHQVRSGFLRIPLDLRDPHGLAVLAAILTSTPGTAWVGLAQDNSVLTLHILDLRDEEEWIHMIKSRYERLLMEIFE